MTNSVPWNTPFFSAAFQAFLSYRRPKRAMLGEHVP